MLVHDIGVAVWSHKKTEERNLTTDQQDRGKKTVGNKTKNL